MILQKSFSYADLVLNIYLFIINPNIVNNCADTLINLFQDSLINRNTVTFEIFNASFLNLSINIFQNVLTDQTLLNGSNRLIL